MRLIFCPLVESSAMGNKKSPQTGRNVFRLPCGHDGILLFEVRVFPISLKQ